MKLTHRTPAEINKDQQDFLSQPHETKALWADARRLWEQEQAYSESSRLDRWTVLTKHKTKYKKSGKPREFGKEIISALRTHLAKLQGNRCCYCRRWLQNVAPARPVEHVLSRKDYPQFSMNYWNLVVCCRDCNQKKKADNWSTLSFAAKSYPIQVNEHFHPRIHVFDSHIRYLRVETNDVSIAVYHGLTPQGRHLCRKHLKTISEVDGLISNNKRVARAVARLQAAGEARDPSATQKLDAFINELHIAFHRMARKK
jgi:uncharacterized protein (TIGR02646 family)